MYNHFLLCATTAVLIAHFFTDVSSLAITKKGNLNISKTSTPTTTMLDDTEETEETEETDFSDDSTTMVPPSRASSSLAIATVGPVDEQVNVFNRPDKSDSSLDQGIHETEPGDLTGDDTHGLLSGLSAVPSVVEPEHISEING
ncbi:hypothetical protein BV898_06312 [Hypsibius exemplaris]|uniref:Syndecan/Neurexin domain-containing protein n=1 Tax=Hypsibius exemplaris TaxID=2072580 RepID=A0A1W0WX92_HYPEX|nr:hypothetical protein BV898_06312 [Hypsibius exemplaris]